MKIRAGSTRVTVFAIALSGWLLSACGGGEKSDAETGDSSTTTTTASELPSSLSIAEYDRLRDALDNDEVPMRIIPRLDPKDRLEFDSLDDASEELIDAIAEGDFAKADRVFASVPQDWRYELINAGHDAAADAYDGYDYAGAYRFDRYLNIDNRAFWILDSDYVSGRVADAGSGAPVAGAAVSFIEQTWQQATETNADGEFRILLPAGTRSSLVVEHTEYDTKRIYNTQDGGPIMPESLAGQTFEIKLGTGFPKLTFRGRVVDADTGEPLAGIPVMAGFDPIDGAVELNLKQTMGEFGRETDANGRFEITELPVKDIHVIAQAVVDGRMYQFQQENYTFEDGVESVIGISSREISLEVPLVVAGTVRDRVTGAPISNASVSAGGWKTERTDKNGRFMIQLATGETWQLTASHDWYHRSQPRPFASAEPRTVETEFLLDPITTGTILGTAINAATGEPIANAVIEIAGQQVRTDSQGRFRAEEIESGEVTVSGTLSGYRADSESLLLEALKTAEATLELDPITTGTIIGAVIDDDSGRPLEGVTVRGGEVVATTGSDGRFVLEEVEAGPIVVAANMPLYVPGSADVLLEAMTSVETEIRLTPITWGTVRGTVVDATTGQPLPNATVRLGAIEISTDANGDYVAERVPAGPVSVLATFNRYRDAQATIELSRDGTIEQSLELEPITTGTIIVTIVDSATGEPVGGAETMIGQRAETADNAGSVTAEEVPAGQIIVNASARLYEPASAEATLEAAGESIVEIELVPITYGTITGTVVDSASGSPLANASVQFAGLELQSDTQGLFRAERVPAGTVSVVAELFRYVSDQQTVELERGTEQQVALSLDPITTGTVRGIVLNSTDGQPVQGATVTIGNLAAQSDADGRFEIENVPAGEVSTRASLALFEPGDSAVNVAAAEVVDTELRLLPITYGTISGTVVNADTGAALPGATVSAGSQSTESDAEGAFELTRVGAGEITVVGSKAIHTDDSTMVTLAAGASESATLRLREITWGIVSGTATDADTGRPLANADIVIATRRTTTDENGRFRIDEVPAGQLQVTGNLAAYEPASSQVSLTADAEIEVTLALVPIKIGDVAGTVVDAKTGEPIARARVTMGSLSAETDSAGRFAFQSVTTGTQAVVAQHPDYANGSAPAEVMPAATADVTIRLDLRREDVTNLEAALAASGTIDLYGIYFDSGKEQFKPSSLQTLRAVLEVMKRAPDRRFRIAGHTDSDGAEDYNQNLSERRARTVIQWLVDNGIDAARLDGAGFGESQPAAPNDTETGKALNRRVQLAFAD